MALDSWVLNRIAVSGLDIATTGTGGSAVVVPRDTTANRPATLTNGMIRYNTNSNAFEFFQNNAWVNYSTGSGGGTGDFAKEGSVTMTGNLRLGNKWIGNDGGSNEGLQFSTTGSVELDGDDGNSTPLLVLRRGRPRGTAVHGRRPGRRHAVLRLAQHHAHALPHPRQGRQPRPGRTVAVGVPRHDVRPRRPGRRRPGLPRRQRAGRGHDRHVLDRQRSPHELAGPMPA